MTAEVSRVKVALVINARIAFAWLPVRRYKTDDPFIDSDGWLWLTTTAQVLDGYEGWGAQASDNPRAKVYSDHVVACFYTALFATGFVAAFSVLSALGHLIPLVR